VARFEDLIRSPGLCWLRRPVASALLWLSLALLRQLIATDSGTDLRTALARGIHVGWVDDALVLVGVAVAARLAWLLLRLPLRLVWPVLAALVWLAGLANALYHRFFESVLELWVLRFHTADLALVAGAAAELGVSWRVLVASSLFLAALVLGLTGRTSETQGAAGSGRAWRLRAGGAVLCAALVLVAVRTAVVYASLAWVDPLGRPLRQQVVQAWAAELLAASERRPDGGWSRDARRARLLSTLSEPLSDSERTRAYAALQAYWEGGAAGAPPVGAPLRATPLFGPGGDPDWPLLRSLQSDAADVRALRDYLGLAPDGPVNTIVLLVESFRALELQHPDIGPHIFPRLRAILDEHAIWFTQAYASAFTAGQTVRGQLSAKCSMLPNALGVAAYIGYPDLRITCLQELYRRSGARTLWLNTSDVGFHNTDRFEEAHGTQRVLGEDFFLERGVSERIGDWGLADGPFLQSSLEALESIADGDDAFFATLLTATSHVPFTTPPGIELPDPLKAALSPGRNRLHRRYMAMFHYMDGALADFFERLFASELGEHTVVVLLGDHSVGLNPYLDLTPIQKTEMRFRIPLAIVSKGLRQPARVSQPIHQIDVAPAVARIAGLRGEVAWLGRDPLSGAGSPWVHLEGERLHYRDGNRACYTLRGGSRAIRAPQSRARPRRHSSARWRRRPATRSGTTCWSHPHRTGRSASARCAPMYGRARKRPGSGPTAASMPAAPRRTARRPWPRRPRSASPAWSWTSSSWRPIGSWYSTTNRQWRSWRRVRSTRWTST
jgi:phosphoglycerol transferase MdoB-like AlkP superfamily enzyme